MRPEGSKKVIEYYQARSAAIRNAWLMGVILSLAAFAYIKRQELGQELQKLSKESIVQLTSHSGNQ